MTTKSKLQQCPYCKDGKEYQKLNAHLAVKHKEKWKTYKKAHYKHGRKVNENGSRVVTKPTKQDIFHKYLIWKSIPAVMKGLHKEIASTYGIEDESTLELIDLKTQKDFANKFKVNEATLCRWNTSQEVEELEVDRLDWAKKLIRNVDAVLYQIILKNKEAQHIKIFYDEFGNIGRRKETLANNIGRGEDGGKKTLNLINPTINQQIINIHREATQKIRKTYEEEIRKGNIKDEGDLELPGA